MKYKVPSANATVETTWNASNDDIWLSTITPNNKTQLVMSAQQLAQIGMALFVDAIERGISDVDPIAEMIDGMGGDGLMMVVRERLRELVKALEH